MDPALWELFQEGRADEEVAAIIRLDTPHRLPAGVRVIARLGATIATCRLPRHAIPALHEADPVASLKAPRGLLPEPEPELTEEAETTLRATDGARSPDQTATGRGVLLGVIDWGFDFAHPDFLNPDGSTRILALWDQRSQSARPAPAPYGYGVVHDRAAINQALQAPDPYQALGYRPDAGSHGTHVAGIAGGNGRSGGPEGVAPAVEFVFVHLASAGPQPTDNLGDSATLLEAVDFMGRLAGDRPLVINTSLGRHGEQHDGTTLVEQGLDAFLTAQPGRALVQSCGNYFARHIHTQGQLRPGGRHRFRWQVDPADLTPNELEVWYSGRDRLRVELRSPDGQIQVTAALGDRPPLLGQGQRIGSLYHRHREPNTGDNHIDIFLYPTAPPGAWEVTLYGE
ncbi:MAG TPA: S8 family serine peptidase, partial [Candidatus Obscuribacterales bacterium]